jgi:hypothetical protein
MRRIGDVTAKAEGVVAVTMTVRLGARIGVIGHDAPAKIRTARRPNEQVVFPLLNPA